MFLGVISDGNIYNKWDTHKTVYPICYFGCVNLITCSLGTWCRRP